jgi:hypothetical protein
MILELSFKPLDAENELIIEDVQTVRVSVISSQFNVKTGDVSWYLAALPHNVFYNIASIHTIDNIDPPCIFYIAAKKSFVLYFVAEFWDAETKGIELPLESVVQVGDFHPFPIYSN